ncbi:hypothetical protein RFI_36480 [Reticulomyxa filosa]|uniref:Uncharacterized protein n=1 Tax=Reticulomyxa filosa TaxID=46433 RepID=X6LJS2_RETFI|nr:hypothetical protein RFI_36480 [Reticulomyxa filosa]|eukprot:ETO00960.1 hypothetical protein RFI_36480 [Reticulomyxa filosa]
MNGFIDRDNAKSIAKIALQLNERQLNKVFEFLMSGEIHIYIDEANILATISSQLRGKYLDNAFQYLLHRFPLYFYSVYYDATQFIMTLKEEQLDDVFKCVIGRLSNEKENDDILIQCVKLIGNFSMKWNERQLIDAFNSLIDIFNDIDSSYSDFRDVYNAIAAITVKLPGRQFDGAFNYLISRLELRRDWMKNK